jgi:hypothetical protein
MSGETTTDVKRDAALDCQICKGEGWHWGWNEYREPVRLRCPCVDLHRADHIAGVGKMVPKPAEAK